MRLRLLCGARDPFHGIFYARTDLEYLVCLLRSARRRYFRYFPLGLATSPGLSFTSLLKLLFAGTGN